MRVKYTKETLEPIIKNSYTWSDVCRKIGIKPASGSQSHIKKRSVDFGIDFSHFLGKSIIKGRNCPTSKNIQLYLDNKIKIGSHNLKLKLIKSGLKKEECERCKNSYWMGEKIVLELDHINNNHYDNCLSNLAILCPNCHSQKTRIARMVKKKTQ